MIPPYDRRVLSGPGGEFASGLVAIYRAGTDLQDNPNSSPQFRFRFLPKHLGHYVYLTYEGEVPLYVGVTGIHKPVDIRVRLNNHYSQSRWWNRVTALVVAEYSTADAACRGERRAIRNMKPLENKVGKPGWTPRRERMESSGMMEAIKVLQGIDLPELANA